MNIARSNSGFPLRAAFSGGRLVVLLKKIRILVGSNLENNRDFSTQPVTEPVLREIRETLISSRGNVPVRFVRR